MTLFPPADVARRERHRPRGPREALVRFGFDIFCIVCGQDWGTAGCDAARESARADAAEAEIERLKRELEGREG